MSEVKEKIVDNFEWYSLKVISGKELAAKENILFEAGLAVDSLKSTKQYSDSSDEEKQRLLACISDFIDEILVPSEKVVEIRNNKKRCRFYWIVIDFFI